MSTERAGTVKIIGSRVFIDRLLDTVETRYEVITSSQVRENEKTNDFHRFVTIVEKQEVQE